MKENRKLKRGREMCRADYMYSIDRDYVEFDVSVKVSKVCRLTLLLRVHVVSYIFGMDVSIY